MITGEVTYENDKPTTAGYWLTLTLVALAIRMLAAFYLFLVVPQGGDAASYAEQAVNIMTGSDAGKPYFFPPGRSYCLIPFFLVFGESETACRANAVVFDVACVLAAAALAHQVLRRCSAARATGWIAAFYPPAVILSGWCYSENVTMLALTCCVCFALLGFRAMEKRGWWSLPAWFLSGGFLGLTIVTRPSALSVWFLAVLGWIGFLALQRFRPELVGAAARVPSTLAGGAGIVFSLAMLGCVAPTVAHHVSLNYGWVVSTNNELNFFLGNNPYTPHYKTWHTPRARACRVSGYEAYFASVGRERNPRSAMLHEALRYIWEHPAVFLLRTTNRIRAFWGFDHAATAAVRGGWPECGRTEFLLCLAVEAGGYFLAMVLVICGLFLAPKAMAKKDIGLLIAVVLAYQLPYAFSMAAGMYHFPIMGLLFPFAGLSLDKAWRKGRRFGRPSKAGYGFGLRWQCSC